MRKLPIILSLSAIALVGCSSSGKPDATGPTVSRPKVGQVLPRTQATTVPQTLDPCALMTAADAAKLTGGVKMTRSSGGGVGSLLCVYSGGKTTGAEITVRIDANAADAHTDFPTFVEPIPGGEAKGLTKTAVTGIGQEAVQTRNLDVNAAIFVRRGNALVKLGAYPPPSLAALKAAAKTALSRIKP